MINAEFEVYKIKRELKRSGIDYVFKRFKKNDFGEPTSEKDDVGMLKGLYHEQSSKIEISMNGVIQVRTKKVPMILCLHKDAASLNLKISDVVIINGKDFEVTGIVNVQEWNMIADISLEMIDNGVQAEL